MQGATAHVDQLRTVRAGRAWRRDTVVDGNALRFGRTMAHASRSLEWLT